MNTAIRSTTAILAILVLVSGQAPSADAVRPTTTARERRLRQYQCPMHPIVVSDRPETVRSAG